jgi:molybdopterin-guanine dinucleotide biosynthesis protein A
MAEALTGVILAGGRSSRFGSDKAAALLAGRALLDWVASALGQVCSPVVVVKAAGQRLPPTSVAVVTVEDFVEDRGPLAGVIAGLRAAPTTLAFVTSCDAPLLVSAAVETLALLAAGYDLVIPEVDGHLQPLVAVYRVSACLPVLEAALAAGTTRLLAACEPLNGRRVAPGALRAADPELDSFRNANDPAALAAIERLLTVRDRS